MIAAGALTDPNTKAETLASTGVIQPAWPRQARLVGFGAVACILAICGLMLTTGPGRIEPARPIVGETPASDLTMTAPSLAGQLKDGRRYRIVADRALMAPGKNEAIALESVRAALQTEDGGRVDIQSPAALFERGRERLTLSGGVVATTADGRRLDTSTIAIWQSEDGLAAKSETQTRVTGPEGTAIAEGLSAGPGLDPIRLTGAARIRLNELKPE